MISQHLLEMRKLEDFFYPVRGKECWLLKNEFVELGRTTTSSDVLVIDMRERIITLNGVSIASSRTMDSTWWKLAPGENKIVLESDSNTDVNYGAIKYKVGYRGI